MRVLFSSDLHALRPAFSLFSRTLAEGPYEAGILAGDLLDEFWFPEGYLVERFGVAADDLLEELPSADAEGPDRSALESRDAINRKGLLLVEEELKAILVEAGKPILLIPGNHDTTPWEDRGLLRNIEGRSLRLGAWNFVGYRWTNFELDAEEEEERIAEIRALVDKKTVLVSHEPPAGCLDLEPGRSPLGSEVLGRLVRERRPRWRLFGHVHGAFGRKGRSVNGAYPVSRSFWDLDLGSGRAAVIPADVQVEPRMRV